MSPELQDTATTTTTKPGGRSKEKKHNTEFYRELLRLSVDIARLLDVGYTRCIMCVGSKLGELVQVTRQEGFLTVATIPEGVNLAQVGICEDLIMVNSLGVMNRKRRSREELIKILDRVISKMKESSSGIEDAPRRVVPFLPQTYIFSNGLSTTFRMMEDHEAEHCYKLWKTAAEKGQGYGADEFPTFDSFRMVMLDDHYCVVIVDPLANAHGSESSDRIIGITLITDSWYTRNPDACLGESSIIIDEEYRGRGLAREATILEYCLMKELGYFGSLNDALLSNNLMHRVVKDNMFPSTTVGVIPDGTFTTGYGWDDQLIMRIIFKEAGETLLNFSEAAKRSRQRNSNSSKQSKL